MTDCILILGKKLDLEAEMTKILGNLNINSSGNDSEQEFKRVKKEKKLGKRQPDDDQCDEHSTIDKADIMDEV